MMGRNKKSVFKEEEPFYKGDVVLHRRFGPGIVVDVDNIHVSVQFYGKPKPITYLISGCGLLKAFG